MVLAVLTLGALLLAGCATVDFKTGFKNKLVTQAQEDLSCPDITARKVKGPDDPDYNRIAIWEVKGCGKTQSYSAYCTSTFYGSCRFGFADQGTGFGQ